MSGISASELAPDEPLKTSVTRSDPENQLSAPFVIYEPLPIIKKKSLGAGVCGCSFIRAKLGNQSDFSAVDTTDWRFRHDSDDSIAFFDGMARCHDHQCVHCKLLLHRGVRPRDHSSVGVGNRERTHLLGLQRFRCVVPSSLTETEIVISIEDES